MDTPTYIPGITRKDMEEEAAKVKVDILAAELGKAHGKITLLEDRLAATHRYTHDIEDRLREEITNAEQAEERVAQTAAYGADAIEANGELAQRILILEGFLDLCRRRFAAQGQTSWAEEARRVLREEKA